MPQVPTGHQSTAEEVANAVSHGIGAALSVAALAWMVTYAGMGGDPWRIVAAAIYGSSLTALFLASTLYHGLQSPGAKHVFWLLDHMAIYLLIAGTYTPFTLVTLNGPWGWSIFGVVWGLAALGVVYQAFFIGRWPWFSVGLYLAMGWVGVVAMGPLVAHLAAPGLALVVLGGVLYTLGVVFFRWHSLPYHHLIWHIFVLAGAGAHVGAVLGYVLPPPG